MTSDSTASDVHINKSHSPRKQIYQSYRIHTRLDNTTTENMPANVLLDWLVETISTKVDSFDKNATKNKKVIKDMERISPRNKPYKKT